MLKVKCDINQQYLKTIDLYLVKSETNIVPMVC